HGHLTLHQRHGDAQVFAPYQERRTHRHDLLATRGHDERPTRPLRHLEEGLALIEIHTAGPAVVVHVNPARGVQRDPRAILQIEIALLAHSGRKTWVAVVKR